LPERRRLAKISLKEGKYGGTGKMSKSNEIELALISVTGVVQGVGFRPFVYQLAKKYDLKGIVYNTSESVKIEVEGAKTNIDAFDIDLKEKAPTLSHIENISIVFDKPKKYAGFKIVSSVPEKNKYQLISPDLATCSQCREEVFDPEDRRYRYPFTNCTNCGPRFTIIEDIPYDRARTTMRSFIMCPQCQAEYDDPLNRRFHAQPNACAKCGPRLELLDVKGKHIDSADPMSSTLDLIRQGNIVAIKGLGGFLLACDARNDAAVKLLRNRKERPSKPFAVMVCDLAEARKHCGISVEEEKLLLSTAGPIVLMWKKEASTVSKLVAPGIKYLGLMLPYTPLFHVLLKEAQMPLVMTSGNACEEPISKDNWEALEKLSGIADYFLVHNRDIHARYDDSVTLVEFGKQRVLRRARGYAPFPIKLPFHSRQVLAFGADEKNTFCMTRDNYAFISQHIGDLDNLNIIEHLENTKDLYQKLFRLKPEIIAYDLHPDYLSSKYAMEVAEKSTVRSISVQHHHAHIVSCMAENSIQSPVIGVALDGTGYGTDGNIWGGEFLIADYTKFRRLGYLEYLPLPGGDAAIRKPYRTAISYLVSLLGESHFTSGLKFLEEIDPYEIEAVKKMSLSRINSPLTSSMGRLFDAVAALIGVRSTIDYEAQAAIELETAAYDPDRKSIAGYAFDVKEQDGVFQLKLQHVFSGIVEDLHANVPASIISFRFHATVVEMISSMCRLIRSKENISQVALSGGVFQNRLLLRKTVPALEADGFKVFTHSLVPSNDGGISLGQAVIGNFAETSKS
jgi:hydrogenase maturation protein HypF